MRWRISMGREPNKAKDGRSTLDPKLFIVIPSLRTKRPEAALPQVLMVEEVTLAMGLFSCGSGSTSSVTLVHSCQVCNLYQPDRPTMRSLKLIKD